VKPARPDRLKLFAVGLFLAMGAGVAVAFLAEIMDDRLHDPSTLRRLIGERPLAVLPYVERSHERSMRLVKTAVKTVAFACVLGLAVLVGQHYASPLSDLLLRIYY